MAFIVSSSVFLLVFLLISTVLRSWSKVSHKRIDEYLLSSPQAQGARRNAMPSFSNRILTPMFKTLGQTVMGITPAGHLEKIRLKLDMAGNPRHLGVMEYLGAKALSISVMIPLGLLALHHAALSGFIYWVAIAAIIGFGFWLPDIILQRLIEARQMAIRRALSHVLDLLVICVEAGVGFDGAVQKVVERGTGPLEIELARALEQVRLGKSRADALQEMGRRTGVSDLISFVAAVTQAEILGVSIAKVLRTQANTARERRTQLARQVAAQLPVKLLFPLVFFIFPALFVVILGPGLIRFVELFKALNN